MRSPLSNLLASVLAWPLSLAACGGAPAPDAEGPPGAGPATGPSRPRDPAPAAAPSEPSGLWKAVAGAEGPQGCEALRGKLEGEGACKSSLCNPARDLAKEWLARCAAVAPGSVAAIQRLSGELAARAGQAPSACAKEHAAVVQSGCGKDFTCEPTAQRWGARCGRTEGTPLSIAAIERAVTSKRAGGFQLDLRTCEELRGWMSEGSRCADKQACLAVVKRVDEYRGRCGGIGHLPLATTAAVELSILAGSGRTTAPIVVRADSPKLSSADLPVVLEDGWGAVLSVCGRRAASMARYVELRAACEKGQLTLARVFTTKAKDVDVRIGVLGFTDEDDFTRRFPSIRAAGELELWDKAELPGLETDLAAVVELARDAGKAPEAAVALARAVGARGHALRRMASLRAALAAKDADLVPALRALGEAKAAAARTLTAPADLAGLLQRGARNAFADVNEQGVVEVGALGDAWTLDTKAVLPRAMAAYEGALEPALKLAALRRVGPADVARARALANEHAAACAAAVKRAKAAEQGLIACGFAMEPCDEGRITRLAKEQDEATAAAEPARMALDRQMTGAGYAARSEIAAGAAAAGCVDLWW